MSPRGLSVPHARITNAGRHTLLLLGFWGLNSYLCACAECTLLSHFLSLQSHVLQKHLDNSAVKKEPAISLHSDAKAHSLRVSQTFPLGVPIGCSHGCDMMELSSSQDRLEKNLGQSQASSHLSSSILFFFALPNRSRDKCGGSCL